MFLSMWQVKWVNNLAVHAVYLIRWYINQELLLSIPPPSQHLASLQVSKEADSRSEIPSAACSIV